MANQQSRCRARSEALDPRCALQAVRPTAGIPSDTSKVRLAASFERLNPFAEVVRAAQSTVSFSFKLDTDVQRRVLSSVQHFLERALCQWREVFKFLD